MIWNEMRSKEATISALVHLQVEGKKNSFHLSFQGRQYLQGISTFQLE